MTRFFAKQSKPNKRKSFFENYSDHAKYLLIDGIERIKSTNPRSPEDALVAGVNELFTLKRLTTFDALRDGYDYFDEVVGATAVPLIGLGISIGTLGLSIWEGAQALAIKMGMMNNDYNNHGDVALASLLVSATSFVVAAASFVKSIISLVTRPIVTAIQGWKEQPSSEKRFYDEEGSIEGKASAALNELADQLFNPARM